VVVGGRDTRGCDDMGKRNCPSNTDHPAVDPVTLFLAMFLCQTTALILGRDGCWMPYIVSSCISETIWPGLAPIPWWELLLLMSICRQHGTGSWGY
jgi:hypothetical protein